MESIGGAVLATGPLALWRARRGARLRQRRRERPLPPLARHRRPRAVLVRLAGRARCVDEEDPYGDERRDADVPLSPGDRRAGVGDARAALPRALLPRRGLRRV